LIILKIIVIVVYHKLHLQLNVPIVY